MSKALIKFKGKAAGILEETDEGYEFQYDREYLAEAASKPVSLTLPLSEKPYKSRVLRRPHSGGLAFGRGPAQYGYQRVGPFRFAASVLQGLHWRSKCDSHKGGR